MEEPIHTKSSSSLVTWGPVSALLIAVAAYFLGQIFGSLIMFIYAATQGMDRVTMLSWLDSSTNAQFFLILFVEAITLLIIFGFIRYKRASYRSLGLTRPTWRDILYAVLAYGFYLVVYIAAVTAIRALFPSVDIDQEQAIGFDNAKHGMELAIVFVSLVVLPPFTEEVVMRGFLYPGLKTKLPGIIAALCTSGLFAVAHLQIGSDAPLLWIAAVDTFILSLVLIYLRDKTGRLWSSITLHALKNGVAFFVLFIYPLLKLQ